MKIIWDLDGVLRDLSGYTAQVEGCPYPDKWDYLYKGKTIYECIDANLNILTQAKPTAYLKVLKTWDSSPEIWTNQPDDWKPRTLSWIKGNIGTSATVKFLTREQKEEHLKADENKILIEDCPKFVSFERIMLIDRPYNQEPKKVLRIFGPKHLANMIEILRED